MGFFKRNNISAVFCLRQSVAETEGKEVLSEFTFCHGVRKTDAVAAVMLW